jgi:hypothetical protein
VTISEAFYKESFALLPIAETYGIDIPLALSESVGIRFATKKIVE